MGASRRATRWRTPYNDVRPTLPGVWFVLVLAGVTFGAVNTGNNMVYVVLATLLAVLVTNNVLAEWNLRGLVVRRVLPGEVFAGEPAAGKFLLANTRRFGAAWRIEVEERDGGGARAIFGSVPAGDEQATQAEWVFPRRGEQQLGRVRVGSRFPFGLVLRFRDLDLADTVLVYPTPEKGEPARASAGAGEGAPDRSARDALGDFAGLRPYRPGDPVRRIHWRTSARVGEPLVVLRTGERGGEVMVEVDPRGGERAIRVACGHVLTHARRGEAVGLTVPGETLPPRAGPVWMRRLLTTLALLPEAG
ncbi:MAG: DUF58 domain-containing protein [Myxococcota bacterium]